MHLFTYGTLMFPAVWRLVVGRDFRTAPATVNGFRVRRAAGQLFPVMYAGDAEDVVRGRVYFDLDDTTLRLLDKFESSLYERRALNAKLTEGGRTFRCEAYLLPSRNGRYASDEAWSSEWFEREGIEEYLRRIAAWRG